MSGSRRSHTYRTFAEKPEVLSTGHKALRLKSGRLLTFTDAMAETADYITSVARTAFRMIKLVPDSKDRDVTDFYWRMIEQQADQLEAIAAAMHDEVRKHADHIKQRERIEALRNVKGREDPEAASYLAWADKLERELDERGV